MPEFNPGVILFDQSNGRYVAVQQDANGTATVRVYYPDGHYTEQTGVALPNGDSSSLAISTLSSASPATPTSFPNGTIGEDTVPFGANLVVGPQGNRAALSDENAVTIYDSHGETLRTIVFTSPEKAVTFLDGLAYSEAQNTQTSTLWADAVNTGYAPDMLAEFARRALPENYTPVEEPADTTSTETAPAETPAATVTAPPLLHEPDMVGLGQFLMSNNITLPVQANLNLGGILTGDDVLSVGINPEQFSSTITSIMALSPEKQRDALGYLGVDVTLSPQQQALQLQQAISGQLPPEAREQLAPYLPLITDMMINNNGAFAAGTDAKFAAIMNGVNNPTAENKAAMYDAFGDLANTYIAAAGADMAERTRRAELMFDAIEPSLGENAANVHDALVPILANLDKYPEAVRDSVMTAISTGNMGNLGAVVGTAASWVMDATPGLQPPQSERITMVNDLIEAGLIASGKTPEEAHDMAQNLSGVITGPNGISQITPTDRMNAIFNDLAQGPDHYDEALLELSNWVNEADNPQERARRVGVVGNITTSLLTTTGMDSTTSTSIAGPLQNLIADFGSMPPAFRELAVNRLMGPPAATPDVMAEVVQDYVDYPLRVANLVQNPPPLTDTAAWEEIARLYNFDFNHDGTPDPYPRTDAELADWKRHMVEQAFGGNMAAPDQLSGMAAVNFGAGYDAANTQFTMYASELGINLASFGIDTAHPPTDHNYQVLMVGGTTDATTEPASTSQNVSFAQSMLGRLCARYGVTPQELASNGIVANPPPVPLTVDPGKIQDLQNLINAQVTEELDTFTVLNSDAGPSRISIAAGGVLQFDNDGDPNTPPIAIDAAWMQAHGYPTADAQGNPISPPTDFASFQSMVNSQVANRYGTLGDSTGIMPQPGSAAYTQWLNSTAQNVAERRRADASTAIDAVANNMAGGMGGAAMGILDMFNDIHTGNEQLDQLIQGFGRMLMSFFGGMVPEGSKEAVDIALDLRSDTYVADRAGNINDTSPNWGDGYATPAPENSPEVNAARTTSNAFAQSLAGALGGDGDWQSLATLVGTHPDQILATKEGQLGAAITMGLGELLDSDASSTGNTELYNNAVDQLNAEIPADRIPADTALGQAYAAAAANGPVSWMDIYQAAAADGLTQEEYDQLMGLLPEGELKNSIVADMAQGANMDTSTLNASVEAVAGADGVANVTVPEPTTTPYSFTPLTSEIDAVPFSFAIDSDHELTSDEAIQANAQALAITAQISENLMVIDEVNGTNYYGEFLNWLNQPAESRGPFPFNSQDNPELFGPDGKPIFMNGLDYGFNNGIITIAEGVTFNLGSIEVQGDLTADRGIGFMTSLSRASQQQQIDRQPVLPFGFDPIAAQNWFAVRGDNEQGVNQGAVDTTAWNTAQDHQNIVTIPQIDTRTASDIAHDWHEMVQETGVDMWAFDDVDVTALGNLSPPATGAAIVRTTEMAVQ
ncbi:hypothetical protein GC177_07275 [bacterium]|nr:hypothetical protein [bacterium]